MVSYLAALGLILTTQASLNPYCSGEWSRTVVSNVNGVINIVLILIVVDNGLVLLMVHSGFCMRKVSLNPYCSGQWSRTGGAPVLASF